MNNYSLDLREGVVRGGTIFASFLKLYVTCRSRVMISYQLFSINYSKRITPISMESVKWKRMNEEVLRSLLFHYDREPLLQSRCGHPSWASRNPDLTLNVTGTVFAGLPLTEILCVFVTAESSDLVAINAIIGTSPLIYFGSASGKTGNVMHGGGESKRRPGTVLHIHRGFRRRRRDLPTIKTYHSRY